MSYTLQGHFSALINQNHEYYRIKETFDYNKDLIESALSKIESYFETYSMHDFSHSLKIINYIERFLGEDRIRNLSITDTYLILSAATLHDFGMIITYMNAKEICESNEFRNYLKRIEKMPDYENCIKFFLDPSSMKGSKHWPVDAMRCYKRIISEYVRANHPLYSSERLLSNLEGYDINLNPNKVFPDRVIEALAEICRLHGTGFSEVMKLEHCSNGLYDDYMHPRYVAVLIRIGDLLDLDNNRFNEDLVRMAGDLGSVSQTHYDKHKSIKAFCVNEREIRIIAESNNINVLGELRRWNNYLISDLEEFRKNLEKIVPDNWIGMVPNDNIVVKRKNSEEEYRNVDLRLNFPAQKSFDFITGVDIYGDKLTFIREYLQNALDSIKICFWRKFYDVYTDAELKKMLTEPSSCLNIIEQYEVQLEIYDCRLEDDLEALSESYIDSAPMPESFRDKIVFVFHDNGIGISQDSFKKRILNVGKHDEKDNIQSIINEIPAYLKPTSSFGVGIHSAFIVTNTILFQTKYAYEEGNGRLITIHSGTKGGYVTCDKVIPKDGVKHVKTGTKAYVAVDPDHIKIDYSIMINPPQPYFDEKENTPVNPAVSEAGLIKRYIVDYCKRKILSDVFPIKVNGYPIWKRNDKSYSKTIHAETIKPENSEYSYTYRIIDEQFGNKDYFIIEAETGHSLTITMHKTLNKSVVFAHFKEMVINDRILSEKLMDLLVPGVEARVNFRFDRTSHYLKINREHIVEDKLDEYVDVFKRLLSRLLIVFFDYTVKTYLSSGASTENKKIYDDLVLYGQYCDILADNVATIVQDFFDKTKEYRYSKDVSAGCIGDIIKDHQAIIVSIQTPNAKIFFRAFIMAVSEVVIKNISINEDFSDDYKETFFELLSILLDKICSEHPLESYTNAKNKIKFIKAYFANYMGYNGGYYFDFLKIHTMSALNRTNWDIVYRKEFFPSVQLVLLHKKYGQTEIINTKKYMDFLADFAVEYLYSQYDDSESIVFYHQMGSYGRTLIKKSAQIFFKQDAVYRKTEGPEDHTPPNTTKFLKCIYPIDYIEFEKQDERREFWYTRITVETKPRLIKTNNVNALLKDFLLSEIVGYKYMDEDDIELDANYYLDNYCIPGIEEFRLLAVDDLPKPYKAFYNSSKFKYIKQGYYVLLPINRTVANDIITLAQQCNNMKKNEKKGIISEKIGDFSCAELSKWTSERNKKDINAIQEQYRKLYGYIVNIIFDICS